MVLVTGSLAFDFIMDFPGVFTEHINPETKHSINVSFLIDSLKKGRGGTAGNISYSLALLKTPSAVIGTVGEDFTDYKNFLSENGVDTTNIKTIKDEFSAQAYLVTDKKDDQITAFYPGAMKYGHTLKIPTNKFDFALITPCGSKPMVNFVNQCKKLKIPYMYDPGQHITEATDESIRDGIQGSKIFIGNDYEYGMIKRRLKSSDKDFLNQTEIIIVTLGEKGSLITTKDKSFKISPAKAKKVLDPTGAGDAYRAGFMAGFTRNFDLKTCGQMGSVASCYAVEKYGTTNHGYSTTEFCLRYKENFQEKLEL